MPPGRTTKASERSNICELALVHGLDDHGLGQRRMAGLALQQEARDDADHLAAAVEGGVGHHAHQADPAAAIDQRYALVGQQFAQAAGDVPAAGSAPKRAPQKTQTEEGRGDTARTRDTDFFLFTGRSDVFPDRGGMVSFRRGRARRQWRSGRRTIGRVMSRTVIWLVAVGAVVIAAAVGVCVARSR